MINKNFLEKFPLYKKLRFEVHYYKTNLDDLEKPAINMYCRECKSIQTFNMKNEYWELLAGSAASASRIEFWNRTVRANYVCSSCNHYEYIFLLNFVETGQNETDENIHNGYVWKVGQKPPWEIEIDTNLEKILSNYKSFYKKGLVNESQGYGIGAYSYYRRIIEEIIDTLLDSIAELIESSDSKEKYKEALKRTKTEKNAEDKIQLVKDLLPPSLRPDNINPLNIIYSSLSEGLHAKTDEECLEIADSIRKSLVFLVNQLLSHKESTNEFTESMKKLLEKKHGKS